MAHALRGRHLRSLPRAHQAERRVRAQTRPHERSGPATRPRTGAPAQAQTPLTTTMAVGVVSLGLTCGTVGGGLIGLAATHLVTGGMPTALLMVLGGASEGALGGLFAGGLVVVNTLFSAPT